MRRRLNVPDSVLITASQSGWMTRETTAYWMSRVWGNTEDDVRRLLIVDEYRAHESNEMRADAERQSTDLIFFPGGDGGEMHQPSTSTGRIDQQTIEGPNAPSMGTTGV